MPFPGTNPPGILREKKTKCWKKNSEKDPGSGFAFKRCYLTRERVPISPSTRGRLLAASPLARSRNLTAGFDK